MPRRPRAKRTQYFDNNGSRGIYHDGWFASTFGPLTPWLTVSPGLATWDSSKDVWELYDLNADFSQADNLAAKDSKRLDDLKALFLTEAKANKGFPIGAGIWLRIHPEDRVRDSLYDLALRCDEHPHARVRRAWSRPREQCCHRRCRDRRESVRRAVCAWRRLWRPTLYMDKGELVYEYNMMIIERYTARSADKLPPGKHRIEVDTAIAKPGAPGEVIISVDGKEVARTTVKRTVPAAFTASETFDVGTDLGSPVSIDYFDRRPFRFDGKITAVNIRLK